MDRYATKSLLVIAASLLACSPGTVLANGDTLTVDRSSGGSIKEVLSNKKNLDLPVTVVVQGNCMEGVLITRDDVSLVGDGGTIRGSVTIDGGRRALIERLSITNPVGDGVTVTNGGSATIRNNQINDSSGYGILLRNASFAVVNDNFLERNGAVNQTHVDASGIGVAQGSMVRAARNHIRDNAANGIEVSDNSTYRSEGDTIVMRTAAPIGRTALDAFRSAYAELRDVTVSGHVFVNQQSQLQVRNQDATSTLSDGNINAATLTFLRLRTGVVRRNSGLACVGSFVVCQCDPAPGAPSAPCAAFVP